MKSVIQLLVPMSGQGKRFRAAGYEEPKPLIPAGGSPILEQLINVFPAQWPKFFVMAEEHLKTKLPLFIQSRWPNSKSIFIPSHDLGPAHAALAMLDNMDQNSPVLLSYCDFGMSWDSHRFETFVRETNCDACLISYRGFHAHYLNSTPYAYSRMKGEIVIEVKEKGSFTENRENEFASAGAYYFKSVKLLREAILAQQRLGLQMNGEYYVSLTVEALLKTQPTAQVRVFEIPFFLQWGTPADLEAYEYWHECFSALLREPEPSCEVDQILMPMAGSGTRLQDISSLPKPFLPMNETPMYQAAINDLPRTKHVHLVALESHKKYFSSNPLMSFSTAWVKETPPGQAHSTMIGLKEMESKKEVLVSACDHGLRISPLAWKKFRAEKEIDALVFTVKNFPGVRRRPKSFSYVQTEYDGLFLSKISGVSVKQPNTSEPWKESLLVGTFWFKSAGYLQHMLEVLQSNAEKVGGELYLDSVIETMLNDGANVREFPLDAYFNWGDKESLAEFSYWQEFFMCRSIVPRPQFAKSVP